MDGSTLILLIFAVPFTIAFAGMVLGLRMLLWRPTRAEVQRLARKLAEEDRQAGEWS